ncbi:MAG: type II toxin-antitoxin system YafQ family toxin [Clostridiales bacterium]|nr:type II toxin-antitoxin system YafQ family toxin [Clostridiales bacterium]
MRYTIKITSQFKRDLKLIKKQGKDLDDLFAVIERLAQGKDLPQKYRDHKLSGPYKGTRECHIAPDFLLIYEKIDPILVLALVRAGSHADLFE